MFIKKTSTIESSRKKIQDLLETYNYEILNGRQPKTVTSDKKSYKYTSEKSNSCFIKDTYIIKAQKEPDSNKDFYNIKVEVTYDTSPGMNVWGVSKFKITREQFFGNDDTSYFSDVLDDKETDLLNDLESALKMYYKDWERQKVL